MNATNEHERRLRARGLRVNESRFQADLVPDDWKCSECGKRAGYFNFKSQVCSEECARVRKSRLQREARHKSKQRRVVVKFVAGHTGS
jgi:hypothetical protein